MRHSGIVTSVTLTTLATLLASLPIAAPTASAAPSAPAVAPAQEVGAVRVEAFSMVGDVPYGLVTRWRLESQAVTVVVSERSSYSIGVR
ncbi:hypothetical protein [Nocardioides sp. W7]|uniref:hypothetical protein n=1 Tax=Nocardioides sp. W7 TaxID=2931390 RepID=UPI001FD2C26E|nr:hypothetical protein [Nocardioides sp. W7]